MRIIKYLMLLLLIPLALGLTACKPHEKNNVIKVGIIDGPDTVEWEVAQKIALKRYGLRIKLIKFSDYSMPNAALNDGDIDANAFQSALFLASQNKIHGYKIIPIANTFLYPIAMYSKKITRLSQLKNGDKIAVPNPQVSEARALLLLQYGKLVTLKKNVRDDATPFDIIDNPKHLKIIALPAAQLPRALPDVAAAVINNDYAGPAGLNPKKALLVENSDSPYMNIIAIRPQDKNKKKIIEMIKSFQTPAVKAAGKKVSDGNAIPGW